MAFWRINTGFSAVPAIDKILEDPDHTLSDVLKEEELLKELNIPNTKLVEYLREPEIIQQLVKYVTDVQTNSELEDERHQKLLDEKEKNRQDNASKENNLTSEDKSEPSFSEKDADVSKTNQDRSTDNEEVNDNDHDESKTVLKVIEVKNEDDNDNISKAETSDAQSKIDDKSTEKSTELTDGNEQIDNDGEAKDDDEEDEDEDEDDGSDSTMNDYDHEYDNDEYDQDDSFIDEQQAAQQMGHIACEILSSDVWSITETLMQRSDLIDELWAVLDHEAPLDMAYANHFTKINENLLNKKTEEMLQYIKSQKNFVQRFMRHIDNPPLMDFLLKVISSDKPEAETGIILFLQRQKLIPSFISFLGPQVPSSIQSAAGDFLKAFVAISANSNSDNTTIGPNELSRELVSEKCVKKLVELMLHGGTGLATGVGVVIEIIRKNNSDYDPTPVMSTTLESHPPTGRDPIYLGHLVKIFAQNIPKFYAMLSKKHNEILKTPFGQIEPLGFERFKICELVAELLHCSNMALLNEPNGEKVIRARDEKRNQLKLSYKNSYLDGDEKYTDSDEDEENRDDKEDEQEGNDVSTENPKEETENEENDATGSDLSKDDQDESHNEKKIKLENGKEEEKSEDSQNPEDDTKAPNDDDENTEVKPIEEEFDHLALHFEGEGPYPTVNMFRNNPVVGDQLKLALYDNQVITYILQMFFKFPWNNFLHNVVFDIVQQVFSGPMTAGFNRFLAIDLFDRGQLTKLICKGQKDCVEYQEKHKTRLGYMGHLTLISEEVVKFTAIFKPEAISPIISQAIADEEWIEFVSQTLAKIREQYNAILGGQEPNESDIRENPNAIILGNGQLGEVDDEGYNDDGSRNLDNDYDDDGESLHRINGSNAYTYNRVNVEDYDELSDEDDDQLVRRDAMIYGHDVDKFEDDGNSNQFNDGDDDEYDETSNGEGSNDYNYNNESNTVKNNPNDNDDNNNNEKDIKSTNNDNASKKPKTGSSVRLFGSQDSDDEEDDDLLVASNEGGSPEGESKASSRTKDDDDYDDDDLGLVRSKSHYGDSP